MEANATENGHVVTEESGVMITESGRRNAMAFKVGQTRSAQESGLVVGSQGVNERIRSRSPEVGRRERRKVVY